MLNIAKLLNINIPIVLASKSPRRSHLLNSLGFRFNIVNKEIDENIDLTLPPDIYCQKLAFQKASAAAAEINYEAIVIGSDTIVVLDGKILNKPETEQQAFDFLSSLSGKTHKVFTAISLVNSKSKEFLTDFKTTSVTFRDLDELEINAYIESGSPMDKAGAYGIQDDFGAVFVSHIEGCYYNIVGLPLELLYSSLKKFANGK